MTNQDIIFGSRTSGSRAATKVRVTTPQSRYNGREGVVTRVLHETAFVRLSDGSEVPFALSELSEVRR